MNLLNAYIFVGMRCALDVGFLVDSSSSMRDCNYEKQKEFVKDIARYLQVPSGMSQTSIVAYSEGATLMKKFNATNSMEGFEEVVDKLPLLGGRAYLDKAMYVAVSTMFTAENGMRNSVPKILIILNDGTQAAVSQSTDEISSMLRKNDIRVLVIGIGEADEQQLGQIVASPDDLIMVENFEDAKDKVAALSEEMCFNRGKLCKMKFVNRAAIRGQYIYLGWL